MKTISEIRPLHLVENVTISDLAIVVQLISSQASYTP